MRARSVIYRRISNVLSPPPARQSAPSIWRRCGRSVRLAARLPPSCFASSAFDLRQFESFNDDLSQRRKIALARRGPAPSKADGARGLRLDETQQLDAGVARLYTGGDFRQQRHAVAIGHPLHHGRERGGAKARWGVDRKSTRL